MPFRHKIRWLLYNANSNTGESFQTKISVLFSDLAAFTGLTLTEGLILTFILASLLLIVFLKNKANRVSVAYSAMLFLFFYLPMSFFAGARMQRLSATWVVLYPVFFLIFSSVLIKNRTVIITFIAIFLIGSVSELKRIDPSKISLALNQYGFLAPEHQSIDLALKKFDFTQPGVIYGLGKTMDLATIIFDLEILKTHPEYSSVFSKRENREILANDFGKYGNGRYLEVIRERGLAPETKQILLFRSGFSEQELLDLSDYLQKNCKFDTALANKNFVLFKRGQPGPTSNSN
jgi:hypothetical protein